MKRKVIQIADSTQLISLPRKWAQRYNIKKGDELTVLEEGKKVVVSVDGADPQTSVEVNVTDLEGDALMYLLRALYIKGYDEIKVTFDKPITHYLEGGSDMMVITLIHEEVNRLSGVEIVQQKENFCVIKDIAHPSMKDFDVIHKRIFLLLVDAISDLIKAGKEGDFHLADSLKEKHNTITRFISNNLRLLNKEGYSMQKNANILYFIIATLDNVTDVLTDCAHDMVVSKTKFSREGEMIINGIHQTFRDYTEFYDKFDRLFLGTITSRRFKTLESIKKSTQKMNPSEIRIVMGMWMIMEQLVDLTLARIEIED